MNRIVITANGPLHFAGQADVASTEGKSLKQGTEFWFCRCGASKDKPFCDGSHRAIEFVEPGEAPAGELGAHGDEPLIISPRPDGPLKCKGSLEVRDARGTPIWRGNDTALCRCGASKAKPFCDGSHRQIAFKA